MTLEFKTLPQFQTKAIVDRTVTGVFCVHGNIDDGFDRSHPGTFAKVGIGRMRVRHLWNHGGGWLDRGQTPPTAVVKAIRELSREQLPESVLKYAPDATGGAEVEREYLDTPRGNEVLIGIDKGAIDEMSYAYNVTKYSFTEDDAITHTVREIHEADLLDTSDVPWGMNPATVGSKSALAALPFAEHFAAVLATAKEFAERMDDLKRMRETDGRSLNTINIDRIKSLCDELAPMQANLQALLMRTDQPKNADPAEVRQALMAAQRTLAKLNGVSL